MKKMKTKNLTVEQNKNVQPTRNRTEYQKNYYQNTKHLKKLKRQKIRITKINDINTIPIAYQSALQY
jgi:phosphopentomutase